MMTFVSIFFPDPRPSPEIGEPCIFGANQLTLSQLRVRGESGEKFFPQRLSVLQALPHFQIMSTVFILPLKKYKYKMTSVLKLRIQLLYHHVIYVILI